jgi:hypothetical protein
MEIVYVALSAFGGGIIAAFLGWLGSGEKFSFLKFLPSILRAMLAGGVIAVSYPLMATANIWALLIGAFLTGAGIDVTLHRLAAATVRPVAK